MFFACLFLLPTCFPILHNWYHRTVYFNHRKRG
jgi:hypothetical protein